MFGIGFTELILISIVAIIFLGPDKLPQAMIDIAKFIKSVKKTISDAKGSLEEEMKIADLKEEALNYKRQLNEATSELQNFKNLSLDDFDDDVTYDKEISTKDPTEMIAKSNSYGDDKLVPAPPEEKVEQRQDETTPLRKKPQKTKVAKNDTVDETEKKSVDDTPKDNA